MSKPCPIINPKARNVIGLYVDELVDMNHPIVRIRLTSITDANLQYQLGVPLKASIKSTLAHIRHLFGDDIPDALVRTTVYLVYAENASLKVKKLQKVSILLCAGWISARSFVDIPRRSIQDL